MSVLMQPWTGWQTGAVVVLAVVEAVRFVRAASLRLVRV
jgi:hypothetical protein